MTPEQYDMDKVYSYHPPHPENAAKFVAMRDEGRKMAELVMQHCPVSRERDIALTKIEEAIMWANAAIARQD